MTIIQSNLAFNSKTDDCLRRVGVIGDIHAEDELLDFVLRHFMTLQLDTILAVGDIVDGFGDANQACALLRKYEVLAVCGNHDRWCLSESMRTLPGATAEGILTQETRQWLQMLPKTRSFETPLGPLLLCHGLGANDMATVRPHHEGYALEANLDLQALLKSKQYRFIVSGHSHEPMVRSIGPLTLINAGTLDRHDRQLFSVIDFDSASLTFLDLSNGAISGTEHFTFPSKSGG